MSTIGATLVMFADEGLREFQDFRTLGLGLTLALFVLLLPDGLTGTASRLLARWRGSGS